MKRSFLFLSFIISTLALGNQCLKDATNGDLLNEIASRMGSGGGGGNHSLVTFSCSYDVLNVNLITSQAVEQSAKVDLDYPSTCNTFRSLFASKLNKIDSLTIIAMCKYDLLIRYALTPGGLKELERKDLDYPSTCNTTAKEINDKL